MRVGRLGRLLHAGLTSMGERVNCCSGRTVQLHAVGCTGAADLIFLEFLEVIVVAKIVAGRRPSATAGEASAALQVQTRRQSRELVLSDEGLQKDSSL